MTIVYLDRSSLSMCSLDQSDFIGLQHHVFDWRLNNVFISDCSVSNTRHTCPSWTISAWAVWWGLLQDSALGLVRQSVFIYYVSLLLTLLTTTNVFVFCLLIIKRTWWLPYSKSWPKILWLLPVLFFPFFISPFFQLMTCFYCFLFCRFYLYQSQLWHYQRNVNEMCNLVTHGLHCRKIIHDLQRYGNGWISPLTNISML